MEKIKVTCDSACDLTNELYDKYQIEVIPLAVSMGNDLRYDGVDVTVDELYSYVEKTGELPKTSAISIGVYEDMFKKYVDQGYKVVHINVSSEMSTCNQNANIAAESVGNVYVVDSMNASTGAGYLALLAVELASADYSAKEIHETLTELSERVSVSFVPETLEYLHKGGRCSAIKLIGANLLKLHPLIYVKDGKAHAGKKYRGSSEKVVFDYIKDTLEGKTDIQLDRLIVSHTGLPEEFVNKAIEEVKKYQNFEEILVTTTGSTIACHCGPGCLGLIFLKNHSASEHSINIGKLSINLGKH